MATAREGPNPLRPYYIPPSIGVSHSSVPNATSAGEPKLSATASQTFSFPDLDYSDYLSETSPSVAATLKRLVDKALWKYATVLLAQPFEVAKLILQVHVAQDTEAGERRPNGRGESYSTHEEEVDDYNSSDEEPNFFTSSAPFTDDRTRGSPIRGRQGRPPRTERNRNHETSSGSNPSSPHRLNLKNPHSLLDALSSLSSNSGTLSMWRATNTTFIYNLLSRTLEIFFRSLLAAVFGVAEADILLPAPSGALPSSSVLTSSAPIAAVLIATASSAFSSLVLSPIDASRTRLILTPSSQGPRSLLSTLHTLSPSYLIPTHLIPITLLTSTLPTLVSASSPLFLKSYLKIDPFLNPNSWSVATFFVSVIDLTIKYPLETVLRRAQIVTWTSPTYSPPSTSSARKAVDTIVPVPQNYRGVIPTMYSIVREEGSSVSPKDKTAAAFGKTPQKRKGQGVEGLYRGWRLGLWSLVGVWGAGLIGSMQGSPEAATEGVATHGGKF